MQTLEIFKKLPLGGADRRAIVGTLAEKGERAAKALLEAQRPRITKTDAAIAEDAVVLILGGSNGITRQLALQLTLGEGARIACVHLDSEKMQIGPHHARALTAALGEDPRRAWFRNADATKPEVIADVTRRLQEEGTRAVHLINGIAAGATKRYAEHGPTTVRELDVAFDPVMQTPDFSRPETIRKLGLVEVEVATDADIERTNRFMGTSTDRWVEALGGAGLLAAGESVVAFCDYDYPPNDPVYALGPLAGAKKLQRASMPVIREKYSVKTARLCYPAMATTALGAIPGGMLMYGLTAQILRERGAYRDLVDLARGSMSIFAPTYGGEDVRLDDAYQATLEEFFVRRDALLPDAIPNAFSALFGREA